MLDGWSITWSQANRITGKKIIADCGYGVVGNLDREKFNLR